MIGQRRRGIRDGSTVGYDWTQVPRDLLRAFGKAGAAGIEGYETALTGRDPEGRIVGNVLPMAMDPQTGERSLAAPRVLDLWNTLGSVGGVGRGVTLGAGPVVRRGARPATDAVDKAVRHYQSYYGQRSWASVDDARADIRRAIEQNNEKYRGLFAPTDPSVVDRLPFVKAPGGKVKISQRGLQSGKKMPVEVSDEPIGSAPEVAWGRSDLMHEGSPESAMKHYGRGRGQAYQGYVSLDQIPREQLAGGKSQYDWSELERGGAPPAVTLRINKNGSISILDGNHRISYWREQGHDSVPAFIIDERVASRAGMVRPEAVTDPDFRRLYLQGGAT